MQDPKHPVGDEHAGDGGVLHAAAPNMAGDAAIGLADDRPHFTASWAWSSEMARCSLLALLCQISFMDATEVSAQLELAHALILQVDDLNERQARVADVEQVGRLQEPL